MLTSNQLLLLVLLGLYLIECLVVFPYPGLLFRRGIFGKIGRFGNKWTATRDGMLFRDTSKRIAFLSPFPPFGRAFAVSEPADSTPHALDNPEAFEKAFDISAIEARMVEVEEKTNWLSSICLLYAFFLFIMLPVVGHVLGFRQNWVVILVELLLIHILLIVLAWRALSAVSPHRNKSDLMTKLIPSPPMGPRALDNICLNALEGFHPLAVAKVLMPGEGFLKEAKRSLLHARHPIQLGETETKSATREQLEASSYAEQLADWLIAQAVDINLLVQPNFSGDAGVTHFCPRCHEEYCSPGPAPECADCTGIELRALPIDS